MNATEFYQKLTILDACEEAIEWAQDKDLATAWATCHRGDWLLWLAQKVGVELRPLTAAKAACAEFARPYMNPQSIAVLDMAHAFGRGECSADELAASSDSAAAADAAYTDAAADAAYYAAAAAADAAYTDADADAAYYAAAYTAAAAADAAYTAAAADAAYTANIARAETLRKCADEVRKHINIKILLQSL